VATIIDDFGGMGTSFPDLTLGSAVASGKAQVAAQQKAALARTMFLISQDLKAAAAKKAAAATMAINIDVATMDQQPDTANTVGSTLLTDLGTAGVVLAAGAAANIANGNGRMPFDPADPNVGSLIKVQNAQGSVSVSSGGGSMNVASLTSNPIILIFILWLIFRKKKASA
jgi:hypothetical protein